jgi:hypothetical protein
MLHGYTSLIHLNLRVPTHFAKKLGAKNTHKLPPIWQPNVILYIDSLCITNVLKKNKYPLQNLYLLNKW